MDTVETDFLREAAIKLNGTNGDSTAKAPAEGAKSAVDTSDGKSPLELIKTAEKLDRELDSLSRDLRR